MKKKFRLLAFLCLLCLFWGKTQGATLDSVTLMEVSASKKSAIIDKGDLEKYKEGMYGKFYIQSGDKDFPKIFPMADGQIIKSFTNKSYWHFSKVYDQRFFNKGMTFYVLTSDMANSGRSFSQKRKHVVVNKSEYNSATSYLEKNKNNVPDKLIQEIDMYEGSEDLFAVSDPSKGEQIIQTYESMKKKGGQHISDEYGDESSEKFFIGSSEVSLADFKKIEDKKLLDSLAKNYESKINSLKYGLTNGLYKNQKKTEAMRDINEDITLTTVYEDTKEERILEDQINPQTVAKIKRDGPLWSADMDDANLRRYFVQSGMEKEFRRRELALNELDGNEILFFYTGSTTDHTTSLDSNYRNLGYNIGFGYDLHLSRTSRDLKKWSLQFFLEKGVADYDIGGQNARGEEGSYGAYLNYYFFNNPLTLNSFIFLGGVGVKAGTMGISSKTLSRDYSCQVLTLPAFQLMTKYRFRSGDLTEDTVNVGLSFNAGVLIDSKRISILETLSDNINGKISMTDIKYLVGMSVFF